MSSLDVTTLLGEARSGKPVLDELLPLVYDELYRLAHVQRRRLPSSETLNTTALVHEAYLKLAGRENPSWQDRRHFFRIAARVMRDVLVDYARHKQALKRGGDVPHLSFEEEILHPELDTAEVLGVHEALNRLESIDERQAKVVGLRYFVGMSIEETAEVLDISPTTVKRDWTSARAWLFRELRRTV